MDNTQGLGEAMHRAAAEDRAKSQEQRIQTLEAECRAIREYMFEVERRLYNYISMRAGL